MNFTSAVLIVLIIALYGLSAYFHGKSLWILSLYPKKMDEERVKRTDPEYRRWKRLTITLFAVATGLSILAMYLALIPASVP